MLDDLSRLYHNFDNNSDKFSFYKLHHFMVDMYTVWLMQCHKHSVFKESHLGLLHVGPRLDIS